MKQEEKEQQLREAAKQDALKLEARKNSTSAMSAEFNWYQGAKSEAAKAYHQQKRFVRTENGTTLLKLVFRKVDEHIKLENTNGWWEEYKDLMLRAEQEQTINVSELTAKLKKWRKENGCNNSDEIIYFILSELK